jgi:hypothetical protein
MLRICGHWHLLGKGHLLLSSPAPADCNCPCEYDLDGLLSPLATHCIPFLLFLGCGARHDGSLWSLTRRKQHGAVWRRPVTGR